MDEGREFEWDEAKAVANRAKHGVSFEAVREFRFAIALVEIDDSETYGEERLVAAGPLGNRIHVLVYTERAGAVRVISLRVATRQETRTYVENFGN